jgi:hypothetical protein
MGTHVTEAEIMPQPLLPCQLGGHHYGGCIFMAYFACPLRFHVSDERLEWLSDWSQDRHCSSWKDLPKSQRDPWHLSETMYLAQRDFEVFESFDIFTKTSKTSKMSPGFCWCYKSPECQRKARVAVYSQNLPIASVGPLRLGMQKNVTVYSEPCCCLVPQVYMTQFYSKNGDYTSIEAVVKD